MSPQFKILSVEERMVLDPEKGTATIIVIRWKHEKGFLGTLEIPKEQLTEEKVKSLVEAEAAKLTRIYNL